MEIKLDPGTIKDVVSEAILRHLDANARETLIKSAIESLLMPRNNGYSANNTTPLQDAFQSGLYGVAMQVARETFDTDETIKANIRGLLAEAYERALVVNREQTVQKLADGIVSAMQCHERR